MLLLAIGGFGATGAYVAFGPSARTSPVTFTATGHSRTGGDGAAAAHRPSESSSGHRHQRPQHPAGGHGHGVIPATGHGHGRPGSKTFGVRVGRVSGLYPGNSSPLRVKYRNPNAFTLDVTRVVVSTPGSGACGAQHFVTGTYPLTTPVHVSPHRSVKSTVPFGMKKCAPDACQGVHVSVDVTATAAKR